jgi:WD40-like Beta Propeller Repeat
MTRRRCAVALVLGLALSSSAALAAQQFNDYRTLLVGRSGVPRSTPIDQASSSPAISLDGSMVAYLGPGHQIFLREVHGRLNELISRSNSGARANGPSSEPAISGNGRNVAFASKARNLGGHASTSVYLRQSLEGRTLLTSRASGRHGAPANGSSFSPAISANGKKVAFASTATNLAHGGRRGVTNVYLRDLRTNQTILISRATDGGAANGDSTRPQLSSTGNAVVFQSKATNINPRANGGGWQVYEYKLKTGRTSLVSISRGGKVANGSSTNPSTDFDGGRVAFQSTATNLTVGPHMGSVGAGSQPVSNIYVRDLAADDTIPVTRGGFGPRPGQERSAAPDLPRDGRFVCFESELNLGNPYDGFGVDSRVSNVYVHDLLHGGTFLISRKSGRHARGGNGNSSHVSCSAGASYGTFESTATNLGPHPGRTDIYWRAIFGGR